jgi:hypothetical protein
VKAQRLAVGLTKTVFQFLGGSFQGNRLWLRAECAQLVSS